VSRILVVSPYPPRHCGIGAYARDQVARFRDEGHDVTVLSPPDGDGDEKAEFLGGQAFRRAAEMAAGFDRVIVHFQPALYFPPRRPIPKVRTAWALRRLAARHGGRLEIVVHEADLPKLWRPDYRLLRSAFRQAGRVSVHTRSEWLALERDYRVRVRGEVIPHRAQSATADPPTRAEARAALDIEGSPLFVCAGFVQPSKGFDRAVRAFPSDADANGARLYVVGSVRDPTAENEAYARELAEACRARPGTTFVNRFLDDAEFDLWVRAADWVILPYRMSWSSAVLARAQVLGTPALVETVGGLPEQAGPHDVVFAGDDGLRRAMTALSTGTDPPRAPGGSSPLSHQHTSDWDPEFAPPLPRKGRGMLFGLILLSVLLAATAQLTLKHGMTQVTHRGTAPLEFARPVETFRRIAGNVAVWAGLLTFVVSAAVWLLVLSRVSLSFAYPFVSLTYALILVFDRFILDEPVSALRWAGVALIMAGILLVSRTHQTA
jgi:glycosyltransferase involved in cell wall biosynthesis/multidrug transporter EmrE-like cation transporter